MENIIQQIKKANPDLQECEIEGLLYILKNDENLTNNKLITLTGIPKETLRRFKQSIKSLLVDDKSENICVSKYGRELLENEDLKSRTWSLAERFDFYLDDSYFKDRLRKDPNPEFILNNLFGHYYYILLNEITAEIIIGNSMFSILPLYYFQNNDKIAFSENAANLGSYLNLNKISQRFIILKLYTDNI